MFGGRFDPIHHGHLISARCIAEHLSLAKVVLFPCGIPPHKRSNHLTEGSHRLAMTRLAVEGETLFEVSDFELVRSTPSFTIETVDGYRATLDEPADLFWIIGADTLRELPAWHRIAELVEKVQIVTAARPDSVLPTVEHLAVAMGTPAAVRILANRIDTPLIEISATGIRKRIAEGKSIRYLVPDAVRSYIHENRLYQESP